MNRKVSSRNAMKTIFKNVPNNQVTIFKYKFEYLVRSDTSKRYNVTQSSRYYGIETSKLICELKIASLNYIRNN